jgi:hypothetical protein
VPFLRRKKDTPKEGHLTLALHCEDSIRTTLFLSTLVDNYMEQGEHPSRGDINKQKYV